MNKTIKLVCLISLAQIVFVLASFGQVFKLKSTSLSFKHKTKDYIWSEWSDPTESSILITIDTKKDRVTIYSNETQIYDIAKEESVLEKDKKEMLLSLLCIDQKGETCKVRLYDNDLLYKGEGEWVHEYKLRILYANIEIAYAVIFLD